MLVAQCHVIANLFGGHLIEPLYALQIPEIAATGVDPPQIHTSKSDPSRLSIPSAPETVDSTQHSSADSISPGTSLPAALQRIRLRIDAGYHTPPVHPYFRDERRVIADMRRLVYFVDKRFVMGVESLPELVEIARKLPLAKQTAIIQMAAAGSVANFTTETVMKHLRQRRLHFVQVDVERVILRTSLRGLNLSLSRGLETQAFTFHVPALHITYSHGSHRQRARRSIDFSPISGTVLNYIRWGEVEYFNFWQSLLGGAGLIGHDHTHNVTLFGLRLRRNQSWVDVYFMKHQNTPTTDWLRLYLWLVW
jgi:hypothetical protein